VQATNAGARRPGYEARLRYKEVSGGIVLRSDCSADVLNVWLPVYVTETRNKEGKKYCPKTIYIQSFDKNFEAHDCRESTVSEFS